MKERKINCLKCEYFYVTWDARFPRGCKAYDFKTRHMPSFVVFQSSGMPCMRYVRKNHT